MFQRIASTLCFCIVLYHAYSNTAAAQDEKDSRSGSDNIIEEIQIYGTKKGEGQITQEAPVMVSVFSEKMLANKEVLTLEDLSFTSPNVSLDGVGTLSGVQSFSIRGLGVNSSIPSIDPTVGIFVDGVYLGTTYGAVIDTFDLESVEIFRGPQGLLFGRNVTGGAVLLRSKRPTGEYGGRVKLSFESPEQYRAAFSAETPLLDETLAGRISVHYKDDRGALDNLNTPGRDVGREESIVIRPILTYRYWDRFNATVIYEHGEMEGDGATPQRPLTPDPGTVSDNVDTNFNTIGLSDISWDQLTLEGNLNVAGGVITNILGWRQLSQVALSDIDGSPLSLFDGGNRTGQEQISNELRYAGSLANFWEVIAGLYYFHQDISYRESRSLLFDTVRFAGGGEQEHDNYGLFLSNDILLGNFTITGGLRYTSEEKHVDISSFGFCDVVTLQCSPDFTDSHRWSNLSPKIGVSWRRSEDLLLYAHWVRGFRSGGYNFRSSVPAVIPPGPTQEEKQDSYEIGVKSTLFERLTLNLAGFVNLLDDLQREVLVSDPLFGVVQGILNTADARILGVELDSVAMVTDNLTVNVAIGYLDGEYTQIRFDLNGDGVVDGRDKDLRIPRLPEWTLTLGAVYHYPLPFGTLTVSGDYSYRSDVTFADNNLANSKAYEIINSHIKLTSLNEKWTLSVYGKNLTDEAIVQSSIALPFAALGAPRFSPLQKGRRFGVSLDYRF